MIVALTGAHGTGKSSVYRALQEEFPDYGYFTEGVRHQIPLLGFNDPYEFIEEYGVGIFEALNINSWSVIDPVLNSLIKEKDVVVTDRSAVDNYAYYLALAQKRDRKIEPILGQLARHYASLVDQFVYFPIGHFPPKVDTMRLADEDYQRVVDANIKKTFEKFNIDKANIHCLGSVALQDRVSEIKSLINT